VADAFHGNPNFAAQSAESVLHSTLDHLEDFVAGTSARAERIDAAKRSKRLELLRRVELARDFLHGVPDRIVPLGELAEVAGLSAFHLARCFRSVHLEPPATYHRNWRLDRAAADLKLTESAAVELASKYGFADQASFTRAFSRRFGASPNRYRAHN
jgi:AraC-like DNA-binding protein